MSLHPHATNLVARMRALAPVLLLMSLVPPLGATTIPVSVAREAVFSDTSRSHAWSADGRFLTFSSQGNFVVPNQSGGNDRENVFLIDRQLDTVSLLSRSDSGAVTGGNNTSRRQTISGDGSTVAFVSRATNLADDLTEIFDRVYVWRSDGRQLEGSLATEPHPQSMTRGTEPGGGPMDDPELALDHDGSTLLIISGEDFGFEDPTPFGTDILLRDLSSGVTTLVSRSVAQPDTGGNLGSPVDEPDSWAMNDAGDIVVFVSRATDLVIGDQNGVETDVFLFDASDQSLVAISSSASTGETGNRLSRHVSMSGDGRYIAFESRATDLVKGMLDGNGEFEPDVFLYDRNDASVILVSASSRDPSRSGNRPSTAPRVDKQGRFLTFTSAARDLIEGYVDGNAVGEEDIFRYEISTGDISLVSRSASSPRQSANAASGEPRIAGDQIVFESLATDLLDGFVDRNGPDGADVYRYAPAVEGNTLMSFAVRPNLGGNGASFLLTASSSGTGVVFFSAADDLVLVSGVRSRSGNVIGDTRGEPLEHVIRSNIMSLLEASATGDDGSSGAIVSDDGRFVAFNSLASNLTPSKLDTGGQVIQVFLYDRLAGENTLLTPRAGTVDLGANDSSSLRAMSRDGSLVIVRSRATDLIEDFHPVGAIWNLFLIDRTNSKTTLISHDASNPLGSGSRDSGSFASVSMDERCIVFHSEATNLVDPFIDLNGPVEDDVFLYDRTTGSITLVSESVVGGGHGSNGSTVFGGVSADCRFVPLISRSDNLIEGLVNNTVFDTNVYRWDRESGDVDLISHRMGEPLVTANRTSGGVTMSADGQVVAFDSGATDLVAGSAPIDNQVFYWQSSDRLVRRVSHAAGDPDSTPNDASRRARVSADGSTVAFTSEASNLVNGVTYPGADDQVFLYELASAEASLVSHQVGEPLIASTGGLSFVTPLMSDDGRIVLYTSRASDLIAGFSHPANEELFNAYRFDLDTGINELLSHAVANPTLGAGASQVSVSPSGAFAAWHSPMGYHVPRDYNFDYDVFLGGADFDADLRLVKTDTVDPVELGESVEYQLAVDNLGDDAATSLLVSDSLPQDTTFQSASGDGWSCAEGGHLVGCLRTTPVMAGHEAPPIIIRLRTDAAGVMKNIASVRAATPDRDPESNLDDETTTVLVPGLLFADGFESGDTSAWSAMAGGQVGVSRIPDP